MNLSFILFTCSEDYTRRVVTCDDLNFSWLVPPKQRKTFTAVSGYMLGCYSILYSYHQKCLLGAFALDHRWLVFIFSHVVSYQVGLLKWIKKSRKGEVALPNYLAFLQNFKRSPECQNWLEQRYYIRQLNNFHALLGKEKSWMQSCVKYNMKTHSSTNLFFSWLGCQEALELYPGEQFARSKE